MMREITFLASPNSEHQQDTFDRAGCNLRPYGVKAHYSTQEAKTQHVACWGWRKGEQLKAMGHDVLVFERGYLGDRNYWTSIAWNGLNGRANFCLPEKVTAEKFNQHFELKPWRFDGEKIIIMGQVMGDMSLKNQDLTMWYEKTAAQLEKEHNKPVFFRPHPAGLLRNRNFSPNIPLIEGELQDALDQAFLVVAYNSNAGVDAVINGIPSQSYDAGSMAWEVTGHNPSDIVRPEREEWAARLAHCQYSPEEIETGFYWNRLKWKLEN